MDSRLVFKKKVADYHPYVSKHLEDSQFVVIKEDIPTSRINHPDFGWGGAGQADAYPSVVVLRRSDHKDATQWPKQRISRDLLILARDATALNDKHAVEKLFKVESGWINGLSDPRQQIDPWQLENLQYEDLPKPEFITTSGNIHVIEERTAGGVRLKTWHHMYTVGVDAYVLNYDTAASTFVHMMATHKDNYYALISSGGCDACQGQGRDIYFPLVCPGDAWVHFKDKWSEDRVEFLPKLPVTVKSSVGLTVRSGPDTTYSAIGQLNAGKTATVIGYHPTAYGIWGNIGGAYIALQFKPYQGMSSAEYYTDWKLYYLPTLRPRHTF